MKIKAAASASLACPPIRKPASSEIRTTSTMPCSTTSIAHASARVGIRAIRTWRTTASPVTS